MIFIIIEIAFVVLNIIEAKLESIVIALKDAALTNYIRLNREEHQWSAIYYMGMCGMISAVSISFYGWSFWSLILVFSLLTSRRLFFEYALKLIRPNKHIRDIEGDQPVDKLVRGVLGAKGGYYELLLLLAALVASVWALIKYSPEIQIIRL